MQPHAYPLCNPPAHVNQYYGFNEEGPFIEVGLPGYGYPYFGAGFDVEGPYMDDAFPGWFFGSPLFGPGPFLW